MRRFFLAIACGMILLPGAAGQQGRQQKPKKESTEPVIPQKPEEQINLQISEMLAAWQFGNVELMHKYYAEDVSVVSGQWEPAIHGWAAYAAGYQRLRERVNSVNFDRANTYVNVKGTLGYASYQWAMQANVDSTPSEIRGHTTLILEKRLDRWLIIHNHTSIVSQVSSTPPSPAQKPPQ